MLNHFSILRISFSVITLCVLRELFCVLVSFNYQLDEYITLPFPKYVINKSFY